MNILHITAHLGGGVGKAISGLCLQSERAGVESLVLLLERPEQDGAFLACRSARVRAEVWDGDRQSLEAYIGWADLVVISWWDHPAMQSFLASFPATPCRALLWCHVNGCHYPYLTYGLAAGFDHILLTSPYSMENPLWSPAQRDWVRAHSSLVYGIGGFDPASAPHKERYGRNTPLRIGYAGTVNYSKLHRQFAEFCGQIHRRVPDAQFHVLGQPDSAVLDAVEAAGLSGAAVFHGYVTDLPRRLIELDVFGYPLAAQNYATSENVLLEAMAAGLPAVAMRNGPERYILRDGETGFLAEDGAAYVERVVQLSGDPALCERLGRSARAYVMEHYASSRNTARFLACCEALMRERKRTHTFSHLLGDTPWDWFLSALGDWRPLFTAWADARDGSAAQRIRTRCPPILLEKRKSSVYHFADTFPEEERLQALCASIKE